jgi:hypothetical protein
MRAQILGLALAVMPGEGVYVPIAHRYLGAPAQIAWMDLVAKLAPLFADAKVKKIAYDLKSVENVNPTRTYDLEVKMAIGGEEEVATAAGKFLAIRIDREVRWTQREKPDNAGVNTWVYWYSGLAKRWVVATQSNVTSKGKQIQLDRWELESYKVR